MQNPIRSILALVAMTAAVTSSAAQLASLDDYKAVSVKDTIYTFDGPMANCVALTGPDGVLLIDTAETLPMTQAMDAALRKVCDKPVKYLVNTHKHFDHVNGNAYYGDAGAKIIAHPSVRKAILTEKPFYSDTLLPASAAPTLCVEKELTLHIDGEDVWIYHPQTNGAHTDGDIVVYFKKANVIAVGDLFCRGMFMFIDVGDNAWLAGEVAALHDILARIDNNTIVIPGHGGICGKKELQRLADIYGDINAKLESMMSEGKTLEEIQAAHITAPYEAELGTLHLTVGGQPLHMPSESFIINAYNGAKAHRK